MAEDMYYIHICQSSAQNESPLDDCRPRFAPHRTGVLVDDAWKSGRYLRVITLADRVAGLRLDLENARAERNAKE
jgi:hypothetical protein